MYWTTNETKPPTTTASQKAIGNSLNSWLSRRLLDACPAVLLGGSEQPSKVTTRQIRVAQSSTKYGIAYICSSIGCCLASTTCLLGSTCKSIGSAATAPTRNPLV